jgi:hypothetical protein
VLEYTQISRYSRYEVETLYPFWVFIDESLLGIIFRGEVQVWVVEFGLSGDTDLDYLDAPPRIHLSCSSERRASFYIDIAANSNSCEMLSFTSLFHANIYSSLIHRPNVRSWPSTEKRLVDKPSTDPSTIHRCSSFLGSGPYTF